MTARRAVRAVAVVLLAGAALAIPSAACAQASPVLPLDDVAYAYLDALAARGHVRQLSALERPYTVAAVRAALDSARASEPGAAARAWIDAADRAARKHDVPADAGAVAPDSGFAAALSAAGQLTAQTSFARELPLADDSSGLHPGATVRFVARAGAVVAAARILVDDRLRHDPLFTGRTDRAIAGRTEDGYAAGQWRYGELFFGRVARSWGPPPLGGLQLGDAPFTYDHAYGRLGGRRLWLSTVVARLDADSAVADSVVDRWMSIHRLAFRAGPVEGALSEMMVWGGVGRGLELAFLNPLNAYDLSQYNETADGNVSFALDLSWRSRAGVLAGQLLVDDLQVDDCDTACREPASWGLTLSLEGAPLAGEHRWFASYTRVTNLAYRAPNRWERVAYRGVGLGRERSDYDEARLGLDVALPTAVTLRPYGALRRQGEGDYRLPYPMPAEYATTPGFLAGTPIRVLRAGVEGAASVGWLEISGDVGVNRARDWEHVAGRAHTAFEGRVRVGIEPGALLGVALSH